MQRTTKLRPGLWAVVSAAVVSANGAWAADAERLEPKLVYAKQPTWAATMLATRANCLPWVQANRLTDGKVAGTPLTAVWGKINADWPGPCGWFKKDLPGNRYLDWFLHARDSSFETWIIGRTAKRLEAGSAAVAEEMAALQRARVASSDPRWLELYGRASRLEEILTVTRRIWLGELRDALQRQAIDMVVSKVVSEDSRWGQLQRWASRCADPGPLVHTGSLAQLRAAITRLSATWPGQFHAETLLKTLDEAEPRWNATLAALLKQDPAALRQLPGLYKEIQALRCGLVLAVADMPDYVAGWSQVDLPREWEEQFLLLQHDLANRERMAKVAAETLRPAALVTAADRDPADVVLRRIAALVADLRPTTVGTAVAFAGLQAARAAIPVENAEARYVLFAVACRLRREVAFGNPRLNFDKLVFIKRHLSIYNHMCDQFYGITARPGGGLYVLNKPFRPGATLRDMLADAVVESGRLKGEKLDGGPNRAWNIHYDGMGHLLGEETQGGSFLAPDVSYDGHSIAFAYVECRGEREHRTHTDPSRGHWPESRCYHVFKVGADGSHLEQLSDGTWNDFDPCWMPSGRMAFISERRGGYLRCGRICPTFTVYDMAGDGRDVRCLSYHETNEWQPSVTNEGLIIYTRWDYVDRFSMVAHHPWTMTPDGRDPRAVQGNYTHRATRPDLEADVRAIPGSHKFVATAAPHHGQSFGSLVLIDPRADDSDSMDALKRVTPDVGFPESQDILRSQVYGEAWPLSEDYFLCAYDAAAEIPDLHAGGDFGLYLVDSFGNKELIYRDPAIGCHSPMPLTPRANPPALSEETERLASDRPAEATVNVVNVYRAQRPWPEGTKITGLRICQVLPLSVGSSDTAHNTGLQIPVSFSINIARAVLGTVPVEADGSASFIAPAGKELFFQALDAEGLAVTSMRSGTQFQPGETTSCQGCHEPRHAAAPLPKTYPLAMQRAPSRLTPDVDGTNPFSYPRLIQPVLNDRCLACHREKADKACPLDDSLMSRPSGAYMDRPTTYYASYLSLTPKFGFYDYGDQLNTIPGRFGAHAAPLYQLLLKGHYDVKLTPEELHRFAVWLDCLSAFYGVYEKEGGQAQLRGEIARPSLE